MKLIMEALAISAMNLRNIRFRLKPTLVAIVGFLGVVLVFVSVLSIREGFDAVLRGSGSDDVAIVYKGGPGGSLSLANLRTIGQTPGIARHAGKPIVVGDFASNISIATGIGNQQRSFTLRGVGADAELIWPKVHVVAGRMFRTGLDEVIVGREAAKRFPALGLGKSFEWDHHHWTVVGIFGSGHNVHESEIWADVRAVQDAVHGGTNVSAAYVRLTSAAAFDAFKKALEHNPQLDVSADRESTRFQDNAKGLTTLITLAGGIIAILMGVGAMFGALNTMYNAVASRAREIATLRALGFGRAPIVISVIVEALILGAIGGVLGAAVGYAAFNGYQASTGAGGSLVAFKFAVTPALLATGIGYALVMGFIGGLFPAIRAARMPVATALREG